MVCCCRIGLNIESIDIALEFESSFAIISLARFVNFKLIWYVSILDDFYSIWNALEMNLALFFRQTSEIVAELDENLSFFLFYFGTSG